MQSYVKERRLDITEAMSLLHAGLQILLVESDTNYLLRFKYDILEAKNLDEDMKPILGVRFERADISLSLESLLHDGVEMYSITKPNPLKHMVNHPDTWCVRFIDENGQKVLAKLDSVLLQMYVILEQHAQTLSIDEAPSVSTLNQSKYARAVSDREMIMFIKSQGELLDV